MLEIENLHVHYGRVAAVQGISLEVREGEIVGLIGPNGAGKSTTLLAITGSVRPTSGDIRFRGKSIVAEDPEKLVSNGIALVPEGRHIFARLTVEENLRLGGTTRSDRDGISKDIERELNRFPILRRYFGANAGKLSGGEQQMLAIARALICSPKLLLLDEPSLGLAPLVIDRVFEAMEELRAEGVTILLVEQNASRTLEIADRTYVLSTGRIQLSGTSKELLEQREFEEHYLGAGVT